MIADLEGKELDLSILKMTSACLILYGLLRYINLLNSCEMKLITKKVKVSHNYVELEIQTYSEIRFV